MDHHSPVFCSSLACCAVDAAAAAIAATAETMRMFFLRTIAGQCRKRLGVALTTNNAGLFHSHGLAHQGCGPELDASRAIASPTHLGNAVIPSLSRLCKVGRVWCRASSLISTKPAVNRAVREISDIGTTFFHALAHRVNSVLLLLSIPSITPASLKPGVFYRIHRRAVMI